MKFPQSLNIVDGKMNAPLNLHIPKVWTVDGPDTATELGISMWTEHTHLKQQQQQDSKGL